ncbi:MAG: cyclic pyranopterin monophosphate synthase MoaC [Pyrinomonadaceae bacterium]
MTKLSHYDETGRVRMVDVSEKVSTPRRAVATGRVILSRETVDILRSNVNPKGNPLEIARIAGVMAAKKTSDLIPLCHQLNLSSIEVTADLGEDGVALTAVVSTISHTGVEMEALTAVSVAALTIYDMCKAVQADIVIGDIRLTEKTGGKSSAQ